jgi:FkbM family methyltransferase
VLHERAVIANEQNQKCGFVFKISQRDGFSICVRQFEIGRCRTERQHRGWSFCHASNLELSNGLVQCDFRAKSRNFWHFFLLVNTLRFDNEHLSSSMTLNRRLQIFRFQIVLACRFLFRKTGFDLVHYNPFESLWHWLDVDLVIDVGANVGQFRDRIRWSGWKGPIISFEPNPEMFAIIEARNDSSWKKQPIALSDKTGDVNFFISQNDNASSLNTAVQSHARQKTITVHTQRLDQLVDLLGERKRIFLKIDAEGHDLNVLRGAQGVFDRIAAVQIEAVTERRYEGETLLKELINEIQDMGFILWRIEKMEADTAKGRDVGFDVIFVHKKLASQKSSAG